jgi:hypothetical protein
MISQHNSVLDTLSMIVWASRSTIVNWCSASLWLSLVWSNPFYQTWVLIAPPIAGTHYHIYIQIGKLNLFTTHLGISFWAALHEVAVKSIGRYILATKDKGLMFVDADFVGMYH